MKKTIYNKILSSQMILISFFAFSLIFFITLFLNLYIKKDVEKQLLSTAELLSSNFNKNLSKDELESSNGLLKLNKLLRENTSYLDINFFILNKDKTIAFPKNLKGKKGETIKTILSEIDGRKSPKLYVKDSYGEYAVLLYEVNFPQESESGYFVLYSDLDKKNNLISTINFIIISIVVVIAFLTFIISKKLSKNIANPILALKGKAINIGNKKYDNCDSSFDIDELQELDNAMNLMALELENRDKTMNTFFQNASHDLRTPLMSIQGYAEGIKYRVLENSDDGIDVIISETKRLSSLVDELLFLSKLDNMDSFYCMENIDMNLFMDELIETSRGLALLKDKRVVYNGANAEFRLCASEDMLSRAILNIVSNSIGYCSCEVVINCRVLNGNFIIEVMDDGVGLDKDEVDKIFDRFYKGKSGGNGLGLTISKGIIEALGGNISCGNRNNGGAFFKIELKKSCALF